MECTKWFVFALTLLSMTVHIGTGCQCIPGSLAQFYTKADSVVKAYVLDVEELYKKPTIGLQNYSSINFRLADRMLYTLSLSAMLKGCGPESINFAALSKTSFAECGIKLKEGQVWMLNLPPLTNSSETTTDHTELEKRFSLNACQGHRQWISLKPEELDFLHSESQKSENMCWHR